VVDDCGASWVTHDGWSTHSDDDSSEVDWQTNYGDDDSDLPVELPEAAMSEVRFDRMCFCVRIIISRIAKSAKSDIKQAALSSAAARFRNVRPFGHKGLWCFAPLEGHHFSQLSSLLYNDSQTRQLFEKFARPERKNTLWGIEDLEEYYVITMTSGQANFSLDTKQTISGCNPQGRHECCKNGSCCVGLTSTWSVLMMM